MKKLVLGVCILSLLMVFGCEKKRGVYGKLPSFSLLDPANKTFNSQDLLKNGLVIVVTAPTLSNSGAQNRWNEFLLKHMKGSKARLVFLEDMTPSSFKETALKEMRKEYVEGQPPILLLDHTGDVRKKLGAMENKTVILVYNNKGELIHFEKEKPNDARAKIIWGKIKK